MRRGPLLIATALGQGIQRAHTALEVYHEGAHEVEATQELQELAVVCWKLTAKELRQGLPPQLEHVPRQFITQDRHLGREELQLPCIDQQAAVGEAADRLEGITPRGLHSGPRQMDIVHVGGVPWALRVRGGVQDRLHSGLEVRWCRVISKGHTAPAVQPVWGGYACELLEVCRDRYIVKPGLNI